MYEILLFSLFIGSFVASLLCVRLFYQFAPELGFIDIPNARSSHQIPTPRGGGMVFMVLWLTAFTLACQFVFLSFQHWWICLPAILLSLIGFLDDRRSLSARTRFIAQCLAALFCLYMLDGLPELHLWGTVPLGIFGILIGIFAIVWSINLFNFMDGIDGITGIEAIFVLGTGGAIFFLSDHQEMAVISFLMVVVVFGFLIWNWPKARIFMGDAGSYCLGFLIAILSLIGDRIYHIPVMLWIILYSVFWFDASVTLLRRIWLKKNWKEAHRDHAYQRLLQAGFSVPQILGAIIVLNSILATIAMVCFYHPEWMIWGFVFSMIMLTSCYLAVERLKPLSG